ncbi:NFX1-type zinc finger-containing protein 1 [Tolypocladium ophioglossoides CBS 100239]|uniref:NFX1-type zinc finger-containing protein 1 n=1 Tax=Tolypocladium ophioglossoides (strain CBS 100239) TaxID=1163406 RepID=A0A0L0MYB9_TOLOC|nr:NFX1-type zinc finger-containing protein 1 [Tolypocladium ophioglossoides CBS 100239]
MKQRRLSQYEKTPPNECDKERPVPMLAELPFVDIDVDAATEESGDLIAFHISAGAVWPKNTKKRRFPLLIYPEFCTSLHISTPRSSKQYPRKGHRSVTLGMASNSSRGREPATSSQPSKRCFVFERHGTCKFGERCKYSHEPPSRQGAHYEQSFRSPASGSHDTNRLRKVGDGKWQQWKRMLGGSQTSRPSPQAVGHFFQLGLEMVDGDIGVAQEVIKLLVSEPGLSLIKDVSDRHIQAASNGRPSANFWTAEVKPLFQLITHPRVIDSAALEQEVAAIFNYLLGIGGSRMARLFGYIAELVQDWPPNAMDVSRMATVELSLAVLSKMLDCNTTNIVNSTFSTLVSLFSKCLGETTRPEEEFPRLQALKYLDYMQRRLEVGSEITEWQNLSRVTVSREQFVLSRDLPGHLSAEGRRHDNDHAEIPNIKILPTYEEIMSRRREYLPTTDSSQWHIQGIRGRLDREFRLVREDTVGQLRDAVREALEFIRNPTGGQFRGSNNVRTYTYDFISLADSKFDRDCGLELTVCCSQPSAVHKLSPTRRRDWWLQSKRLQAGALVCIMNATGSVLFCAVSNATMRNKDDTQSRQQGTADQNGDTLVTETTAKRLTLSEDPDFLYVKLELVDTGQDEIGQALRCCRTVRSSLRQCVVEFPGVLLASFKHTLEALQQMYRRPNIPFSDVLAPSEEPSSGTEIELPLYARKAGFTFNLKCLTQDNTEFTMSPRHPLTPEELASRSTLDITQSSALLNALSRELSLIQGPPGTGKSYTGEKIIKVLLKSKKEAQLGPILCVCYTNHALDQLLEHLLDDGISQIIRIGSRSKSERLQDLNLRTVARAFDRTRSEKSSLYHLQESICHNIVPQVNGLLVELSGTDSWRTLKNFLVDTYPSHHDALFGKTENGWEIVTHQPEKTTDRWLAGGSHNDTQSRPLEVLKRARLSTMNNAERQAIHSHWVQSVRDPIISGIRNLYGEYNGAIEQRARVRSDVDLRCLQQADVVGVTTTGLARNLELFRRLRCKVMLCEEAGESTNPRGRQYSLDTSLFERLIQPTHTTSPSIPFSILETQRRMHPSISELVRWTLYPALKDADTVMSYPKVVGVKQRLFWLHHNQLETAAASHDPLNTSHSNDFEVEMTASLVSHLIRQGEYSQGDIAVITPYLGQLHRLRHRMESMFEICLNDRDLEELEALEADSPSKKLSPRSYLKRSTLLKSVRVATVDNFQGEEAKVIVISLVRSNPQNKCGFLSNSNRINVLLSRAQHGMYIIGNADTYNNVSMWADVIDMLQKSACFGRNLELQCPRHPDARLLVSQPDHFLQFSPETPAFAAILEKAEELQGRITASARLNAVGITRPAAIAALRRAMMGRHALPAASLVRFVAAIRNVVNLATNLVLLARRRSVSLVALIRSVRCHARRLAIGYHALSGVRKCWNVATNVSQSTHDLCVFDSGKHDALFLLTDLGPSLCGESCPKPIYCQQCGSKDIKSTCVDFLEMKENHEIDLDEEPCIFPDCGHFLTISSMDGQMDMASHYQLDENGLPTKIQRPAEPFSMNEPGIRVCANCRGPLRNLSRYGRIVRRAMLDEATKKFVTWSNAKYQSLAESLLVEQEKLEKSPATKIGQSAGLSSRPKFAGSRLRQLLSSQELVGNGRYDNLINIWRKINAYASQVRKEEQPYQRVADLVLYAIRQNRTKQQFLYDGSVIQLRGSLNASILLLKCDIVVFSDLAKLCKERPIQTEVNLVLSTHESDCAKLIELSRSTIHPREEVQGHIIAAHLRWLALTFSAHPHTITKEDTDGKIQSLDHLRQEALNHLAEARMLLEEFPSTAILEGEINATENMINGGVYRPVTAEELRDVYRAMAGELRGTGHWYTCERGHPFTIAQCGMPMEEARCPECSALIGGQNHVAVQGVRRAVEIEEIASGVDRLDL